MATATKVISGLADKIAGLLGQRADLIAEAMRPSQVELIDQAIEKMRNEMATAQVKTSHEVLIELRKAEKAQMERVIASADALWSEIEALDPIWKEQAQVAPGAAHLAAIPVQLAFLLKPGWHGGRRTWAHTKRFANFDYLR